MKKCLINLVVLLFTSTFIFTSCNSDIKEYSGFPVEKDIVTIIPNQEETLSMPWPLYKGIESGFVEFSKMFNRFGHISNDEISSMITFGNNLINFNLSDAMKDEELLKSQLGIFISDEKEIKKTIKAMKNIDADSVKKIDDFVNGIVDKFDCLLFSVQQVCEFDNGDNWFDSYEDIFNAFVADEDQQASITYINKYFPAAKLISSYSEVSQIVETETEISEK